MKPPTATVNGAETRGENGSGTEAGCGTLTAQAITTPQRAWLEKATEHPLGLVDLHSPRGLRRAGWERMMGRLAAQGLVTPYRWGGYEITDAGRKAISPPRPTVEGMGG